MLLKSLGPLDSGDTDYPAMAAQNVLVFVQNVFKFSNLPHSVQIGAQNTILSIRVGTSTSN